MRTNRFHLVLVVCILFLSGLACELEDIFDNINAVESRSSWLMEVKVSPTIVHGAFDVIVTYYWRPVDSDFKITCIYPDFDQVASREIPLTKGQNDYKFTLGVKNPGNYEVKCEDNANNGDIEAFKVEDEQPADKPEVQPPSDPNAQNTSYGLTFDPGTAVYAPKLSNSVGLFGCWLRPLTWWPSITVSDSGDLSAICSYVSDAGALFSGTMHGKWDRAKGTITFTVEYLSVIPQSTNLMDELETAAVTLTTTITGKGSFTSDTQASGKAKFTQVCKYTTPSEYNNGCTVFNQPYRDELTITGEIPWTFTIYH